MISDKTIEENTAKYWCAFASKDFKNALDKILKEIASKKSQDVGEKIANNMIDSSNNKLNEGFIDFLSNFAPSDPAAGSVGIVGDLSGKSKEEIQANATAMGTAALAAATVLTPVGRSVAGTTLKTMAKHPGTTLLAGAAAKLGMDAVSDKDDSWIEKLKKLVCKVWDISMFAKNNAKLIAIAGTTAYALFKTAGIWMPLVASCIKAILRGDSLAIVDFDSNGTWYRMRYDIKSKRWELMYKGFSMGASPAPEEVEQLMDTKFFKSFLRQCEKYIQPIAENEDRQAVIEAISAISDKNTKKALDAVFNDKQVLDNMFALKFKY